MGRRVVGRSHLVRTRSDDLTVLHYHGAKRPAASAGHILRSQPDRLLHECPISLHRAYSLFPIAYSLL